MKSAAVVVALTLLTQGPAFAEEGHSHKAPHGGQVKEVAKHHLEALVKDGSFFVYLLDEKENTLPPPKEARAVLQIGKAKHELKLTAMADHLMTALDDDAQKQLAQAMGKAVAIVTLHIDDKPQSARFKFSGESPKKAEHEEHEHEHGHDHHH
ncbi:MAG: hypothetical protein ACOZIN_09080 [Myxococcota bacterium]